MNQIELHKHLDDERIQQQEDDEFHKSAKQPHQGVTWLLGPFGETVHWAFNDLRVIGGPWLVRCLKRLPCVSGDRTKLVAYCNGLAWGALAALMAAALANLCVQLGFLLISRVPR